MSGEHPRWREFRDLLQGLQGCNFREGSDGQITWQCNRGLERPRTRAVLEGMGFDQDFVERSLGYFAEHGGYCDCEVLFNVDPDAGEEAPDVADPAPVA